MNRHLVEAQTLLRAGRFHEAAESCRKSLRVNRDSGLAVRMLAVCHYNLGVMKLHAGAPLDAAEAEFRRARGSIPHAARKQPRRHPPYERPAPGGHRVLSRRGRTNRAGTISNSAQLVIWSASTRHLRPHRAGGSSR
jgi:hypothetical protein